MMKNMNNFEVDNHTLLAICVLTTCFALTACSDLLTDCDPEFDEGCICTLDDDQSIDVTEDCINGETSDEEFCTCALENNLGGDPEAGPGGGEEEEEEEEEENTPSFRFVMVEDLTVNRGGDFPGADVDAVSIIKSSGDEIFASAFSAETDVDCTANLACDPSSILGAPDAVVGGNCFDGRIGNVDPTTFTALNGGFAVLQFGSESRDATIENGDDIRVYEIGATQCSGSFDDDPYSVAVSVSDDLGSFVEMGTGGQGVVTIPISGL
jgi:hypothetical protein